MNDGLQTLVAAFKKKLNDFILTNGSKINFDHAQYNITEIHSADAVDSKNNGYEILLSVTGMGTQHFVVRIVEDEFLFRGKMIDMGTGTQFPHNLISDLVYGVVQEWFSSQQYDFGEKGDIQDAEHAAMHNAVDARDAIIDQTVKT